MKISKSFFIIAICYLTISTLYVKAVQDEDWENNYFGKVIGWIIDPETNKPVNEEFYIRFYFINSEDPKNPVYLETKSNDEGFFSRKLYPGKYYVDAWPLTHGKYCIVPGPLTNPDKADVLDIKNGQITKMYKKAGIGGDLLVILVGPDGQKINTDNVFGGKRFAVSISNKVTHLAININNEINPSNDKREFYFKNYASGEYDIEFYSKADYIASQTIEDIIIKKNETTVYELVIDINTGIKFRVTDVNGVPKKSVGIWIRSNTYPTFYESGLTDVNGYFTIVGLREGTYYMHYFIETESEEFYGGDIGNINVKKGTIKMENVLFKMVKID